MRQLDKIDGEYMDSVEQAIYSTTFSGAMLKYGQVTFNDEWEHCFLMPAMRQAIDAVRLHRAGSGTRAQLAAANEQQNLLFLASAETEFKPWPDKVRGIVEANDFEYHALWREWSLDARVAGKTSMMPDDGVPWEQLNAGTSVTLRGTMFNTHVSMRCAKINGHLVLFWYCLSSKCDHALVEDWLPKSFPKAVASLDANNFHAVVQALSQL